MSNVELIPGFETRLFNDIYTDLEQFQEAWDNDFQVLTNVVGGTTDRDPKAYEASSLIYYLLSAQYGNSPIANSSENQFKLKLFSTVFKFAPTWLKKLDVQEAIRELDLDSIRVSMKNVSKGSDTETGKITGKGKNIANHALNPGTEPSTDSLTELTYIDSQNTDNTSSSTEFEDHKHAMDNTSETTVGILDGYEHLLALLESDVTTEFINRFQPLFKRFVKPQTYLYVTEGE